MSAPSAHVLDLFAVPDAPQPLPGGLGAGRGGSVHAGDLVLSPGRDADVTAWLGPVLARFAVGLDERPDRTPRDLRVAVPVPARDGAWVVDGWAATRWEPGTTTCRDLGVSLAAGRLLHAELASLVPTRPDVLARRTDEWADDRADADRPAVRRAAASCDNTPLGPDQLVHTGLAGNVLLDPAGAPVVIDVSPAWRPVLWAEALCVVDSVLWWDAPWAALDGWCRGRERQALLRAVLHRAVDDGPGHDERYFEVLDRVLGREDGSG